MHTNERYKDIGTTDKRRWTQMEKTRLFLPSPCPRVPSVVEMPFFPNWRNSRSSRFNYLLFLLVVSLCGPSWIKNASSHQYTYHTHKRHSNDLFVKQECERLISIQTNGIRSKEERISQNQYGLCPHVSSISRKRGADGLRNDLLWTLLHRVKKNKWVLCSRISDKFFFLTCPVKFRL